MSTEAINHNSVANNEALERKLRNEIANINDLDGFDTFDNRFQGVEEHHGGMVAGATRLKFGTEPKGPPAARTIKIRREGQNLWIGETSVAIVWDSPMEGVDRPWFKCACGRKVRYLYLRDTIRCAKCHGLQHACLHQGRQMPALRRVERLRRRLGGCELRPFTPLPDTVRRLGKRGGGRSKSFHDALVAQILEQEAQLVAYLGTIVYDLDRRLKGPRGRKKCHGQTP